MSHVKSVSFPFFQARLWGSRCKSFALVIFALLAGAVAAPAARTIVIDAGHGGHDRGGVPGQRVPEKVVALDVARRLQARLQAGGHSTVMTRNADVFVSLGTRVAIANRQRGAIMVSVHFNSAPRVGARGFETFYYNSSAYPLAARIQSKLLRLYPTENRGVKRRGFYVLRKTAIPAVLVECGFLTNPQEARLALSADHRQRLADAIAAAVMEMY